MIKRIAEKAYQDFYSVAPKYRTGEYMQMCVESAIREALEAVAVKLEREASGTALSDSQMKTVDWAARMIREMTK